MTQIWNIFRKDVRHHWKEIALSLALLLAFARFEVRGWSDDGVAATGASAVELGLFAIQFLSGLVTVLVPVSWVFLIVRVVQGEALVGDRQFWVTRPYDWKKLLVAKVLFVFTFVNLPLLILDIFLLAHAGFHPTAYLRGLLWMQLMWILTVFLATAVLASVTASIPQMLLALLLAVLYMVGLQTLSQAIPSTNLSGGGNRWTGLLFIAVSMVVIFLQYSQRKTSLSRWVILGFGILLTLVMVATPYRSLIAHDYPSSDTAVIPQLNLQLPHAGEGSYYPTNNGTVPIWLPLDVSGIAKDSIVELNGMVVTLTSVSGVRWDSGWQVQSEFLFPDSKRMDLSFGMKQKIYDQLKSAAVNASLLLAFTSYQNKNQRRFVIPAGQFALSDVGLCLSQPWYGSLRCLVPLRRPRFLLVTTEATASTCPLLKGQSPPSPGDVARGWIQGGSEPADMGISPIHEVPLQLFGLNNPDHGSPPGLCSGTPIILSNPETVGRSRVELKFDNLNLEDYRQRINPRG